MEAKNYMYPRYASKGDNTLVMKSRWDPKLDLHFGELGSQALPKAKFVNPWPNLSFIFYTH